MSDQTLKPCPFCGHAAQIVINFGEPVVRCINGVYDLCDTEWLDEEAWNTRPVEDALRARAEAAEAALATARAEVARLRAELEAAREVDTEQQKAWDDRGWSLTP